MAATDEDRRWWCEAIHQTVMEAKRGERAQADVEDMVRRAYRQADVSVQALAINAGLTEDAVRELLPRP